MGGTKIDEKHHEDFRQSSQYGEQGAGDYSQWPEAAQLRQGKHYDERQTHEHAQQGTLAGTAGAKQDGVSPFDMQKLISFRTGWPSKDLLRLCTTMPIA
ncbi:MAG: hypothetical protein ACPG5T_08650 [Endozoicomonas sp.]